MNSLPTCRFGRCAVAVGLALLMGACAGEKVTTKTSPQLGQYRVRSVVVLPFQTLRTPQVTEPEAQQPSAPPEVLKSDIEMAPGTPAQRPRQLTAAVPSRVGEKIARIMTGKLRRKGGLVLHPPAEAQVQLAQMAFAGEEVKPEEQGRRVAIQLKADAALAGLVRVYRERVGSKYGAEGAVVGFEVKLVATDGRVLWAGSYYERQRPVTEDFSGFWERGFGFVTAEELAEYGAEHLVREFPFGG